MRCLFTVLIFCFALPFGWSETNAPAVAVESSVAANNGALERLLRSPVRLYSLPPETVTLVTELGFTWNSATDRSVSRATGKTFFGLEVPESFLRLDGKVVTQLELVFYTRGDQTNALPAKTFAEHLQTIEATLTKHLRRKPAVPPDRELGGESVTRKAWVAGRHQLELSVGEGAFIRLGITPRDPRRDPYKRATVAREGRSPDTRYSPCAST